MEEWMLTAVTAKSEIAQCQQRLEHVLKTSLPNSERLRIGHQGGSFVQMVFHGPGLWYSTCREEDDVDIPRYWNGLGQGKRDNTNQVIAVEINAPLKGYKPQVAGLFARDTSNEYVLLHRGRLGGGAGITKLAFRNWCRSAWVEVAGPENIRDEVVLVGHLGTPSIVDQIRTFVSEVATFKREVEAGHFTRTPSSRHGTTTFNPEFHGKKKGHRSGALEYDSFHGLVVNTLAEKFSTATRGGQRRVFNTSRIDLGIEIGGHLRHLYEVKSSADSQAIYTGTGQLMLHSPQGNSVTKNLVLPKGELSQNMRKLLDGLGIAVLEYEIERGHVTFSG
jgi:hypothetical protein